VIWIVNPAAGSPPRGVTTRGAPMGAGFAESLARPGRNITGLAFESSELHTKRLHLLKEVIPAASRIAFLYYPGERDDPFRKSVARNVQKAEAAARALNLTTSTLAVEEYCDFH